MSDMSYWFNKEERAKAAKKHTKLMEEKYADEIKKSVESTVIHDDVFETPIEKELIRYNDTKQTLWGLDTVSALYSLPIIFNALNNEDAISGKKCLLNFASFKNPGGMFLEGSGAQEECLCHESNLYNILVRMKDSFYEVNKTKLNKALYTSRLLYTPDVIFDRINNSVMKCDVITCAAPNFSAASRHEITEETIVPHIVDRIMCVLYAAAVHKVDTLILGAFGCGVFGNDPYTVAQIFDSLVSDTFNGCFDNVIYAVPDKYSTNFKAFRKYIVEAD